MSGNQLTKIDYRTPAPGKNDYRTSSYLAHRYIPRNVVVTDSKVLSKIQVCKDLSKKDTMIYNNQSEQRTSYKDRFQDTSNDRVPRVLVNKAHYIKPYDEQFFKSAPRPINELETEYNKEYIPKKVPEEQLMLEWKCPPRVKKSNVLINPALPGYTKYLDMMATTNMLTYVHHIPENVEQMSANNNVTLWKWFEFKPLKGGIKPHIPEDLSERYQTLCQEFPADGCPKRREMQTRTKHVPNKGLTTETRENYKRPESKIDFRIEDAEDLIQFTTRQNFVNASTEAQMYGSNQRIQKYIDVRKKCTATLDCPPLLLETSCGVKKN